MPWTWTLRCIGIVRTMIIFGHLIFVWEFCDEMFRYCEDNTYIIVIAAYGSCTWSYGVPFLSFLRWLWLSLWGRHCFDTTLIYPVDWLLQWSKDFSDTTVFGWPTLTMSNRSFYSTLRLEGVRYYLYVKSWFGERTLCSDYVLYPEEGCTDTLCESLRSWEVSQIVTNELVIHVWMRTSLFWELLEVFRWFWIHLVKLSFVDF